MTPHLVTRFTVPIAAVSALLLGLAIVAAWYIQDMQERASGPMANSVSSMAAARELEIYAREVSVNCNRYLITYDEKYLQNVPPLKDRIEQALARAREAKITPAEDDLIKQIEQGYKDFYEEYQKQLPPHNPPAHTLYPKLIELTDNVLAKKILEPTHEYLRLNEEMLKQASDTNQQLARRLTNSLLLVGLCGSAGGLLAGWVIAVTVRRSIRQTQARLRDAARQLDAAVPGNIAEEELTEDTVERVSVSVSAVVKRLRQTEKDALRAEQLAWVGQMAAGIAHEIRNPLMAIKLLVQTAADRPDGASLRPRDFQVLEEEIVRLEAIVSGFLDFARPPRLDPRPVDLLELAGQVAAGLQPRADLQGVEIVVEQPVEPVVANADPNQLRQVLLNLLINALDVQPRGGEVRVAAEIVGELPNEPQVVLTVMDSGTGLPEGVGERIFEPFVSTKESGLGLGLSICRRIVEAHGGTLTAANRLTGGAIFTIRFPTRLSAALQKAREVLAVS
jgi:two-component system sensor histidine kinase HydH